MSQNNVYRRNDTNSTTNTNSTANANFTTGGISNVNGSFGLVLPFFWARSDALTPIHSRVYYTLDALSIGKFNKTLSANPAPINFNEQKNLFNSGSGSIDVGANVQASVSISAVAAGTIIPPKVTEFEIIFGMSYHVCWARPSQDSD